MTLVDANDRKHEAHAVTRMPPNAFDLESSCFILQSHSKYFAKHAIGLQCVHSRLSLVLPGYLPTTTAQTRLIARAPKPLRNSLLLLCKDIRPNIMRRDVSTKEEISKHPKIFMSPEISNSVFLVRF